MPATKGSAVPTRDMGNETPRPRIAPMSSSFAVCQTLRATTLTLASKACNGPRSLSTMNSCVKAKATVPASIAMIVSQGPTTGTSRAASVPATVRRKMGRK